MMDKFYSRLARMLPAKLRYWVTIQSCVEATTGPYSSDIVTEVTIDKLLQRIQK